MIGKRSGGQGELWVAGSLESLVPADHILKRVDHVVDLSFVEGEVRECYCTDNGRPGLPPETAVRLMVAGLFQGIVHDRKLLREAQVNLAIRWFCGYALDEPLPDHSTLTRVRQRWGAERFRRIFEEVVRQCVAAGLVSGETLHCDATLIRADVSWESLTTDHVSQVLSANTEESGGEDDEGAPPEGGAARASEGGGGGGSGGKRSRRKRAKKRSLTDPDASMATSRHDHHLEPSYKQHTAVDGGSGVIVDVAVTTGEQSESGELLGQVDRVESTTGRQVRVVTGDGGYSSGENYAGLEERGIEAVIPPPKRRLPKGGRFPLSRFKYDAHHDVVRCPGGKLLRRYRGGRESRWYRARAGDCSGCDLRERCVPPSSRSRAVCIVEGYAALLRARRRRAGAWPEAAYRQHRWRVEGVHGVAKTQHGLRRAARRGLENVAIQAYLTAMVMNLKRLAFFAAPGSALRAVLGRFTVAWIAGAILLGLAHSHRLARPRAGQIRLA